MVVSTTVVSTMVVSTMVVSTVVELSSVRAVTSSVVLENGDGRTPPAEAAAVPAASRVTATTATVRRVKRLANMEVLLGEVAVIGAAVTVAVNCCTIAAIPSNSPAVAG